MTETTAPRPPERPRYLAHIAEWERMARPFGSGGFGAKAEAFARFFGTPTFLIGQTIIVGTWIALNSVGVVHFDIYPFILLNLAFSLQAAYAAPLILLAQTRQADRDKALAEADAKHRDEVSQITLAAEQRADEILADLRKLLEENTTLTSRVDALTQEIHSKVVVA